MSKKPKLRFTVGDWVVFSKTASLGRTYDHTVERHLRRDRRAVFVNILTLPRAGMIVGHVTRYEGEISPASGHDEDFEPACFIPNKAVQLWQIRESLCGKIQEALDADVTEWPSDSPVGPPPLRLPERIAFSCSVSDEYRQEMREAMRGWPRGSDGKWLKKSKVEARRDPAE